MIRKFLTRVKRKIRLASDYHAGEQGRFYWFTRTFPVGFELPSGAGLLDAGCGCGRYVFYLVRSHPNCYIKGIDIDEAAIATCKKKQKDFDYRNVNFCVFDLASDSGLGVAEYNMIYCIDVLNYIADDQLALNNITRALRSRGMLYVHVPLLRRKSYFKRSIQLDIVPDAVRDGYNVSEFLHLLTDSGLEAVSTQITFGFFGGAAWELWKINATKGIVRLALKPLIMLLLCLDPYFPSREGRGLLVIGRKIADDLKL